MKALSKAPSAAVSVRAVLAVLVLAFIAILGPASAQAASEHPFLGALDSNETPAEEFGYATGVSVDDSGYVYVSSYETSAIDIFNPAHEYVTSILDTEGPANSAVDSEGNLYVKNLNAHGGLGTVELFSPDSYPPTGTTIYTPSLFFDSEEHDLSSSPHGVAVNPSNDHVLISEGTTKTISEYKSVAEGSDFITSSIGKGLLAFEPPYYEIAVDGVSGDIYLFVKNKSSEFVIAVLSPDGTSIINEITGVGSPQGSLSLGSFGTGLAVDQSSGYIYIPQLSGPSSRGEIYEFKPDGTFVSAIGPTFGDSLSFIDSGPSGLAVDNSSTANAGNVYVGSGILDAQVYEFGPLLVNPKPLTVTKAGTGSGTVSSSPLRIECGSKCSAEFSEGETVTLTAAPAAGSKLSGWSGCTSEAEAGKKCLVTIGATNAVTATFEPKPKFALSVSKDGTGAGSITSSPAGIDCGSTCSAEYEEGAEVTLSPSATSGSSFAGWSGACTGTGTCKVTVDAAKAVTATFNINASGGGGTTTTPPPTPTCATDAALCPPGTASVASKAQVKSGKAALSVTCPGPGACSGKVTLTAKITTGKGKNKKTKKQTIGSASFSLTPGGSSTVQVKLTGAAKSAIAKGTLKASVSGTGVAAGSVKLSQGGGK